MKPILFQPWVSAVIALLIINNFFIQHTFIPQITLSWPSELRMLPPGYHIQPLKQHLDGIRVAGYYTDLYDNSHWMNPEAAVSFQRSQYALSPTLLDIKHCFNYNYVVFDCDAPDCFQEPVKQYGYDIIYKLNNHTVLARKK